MITFSFPGEVTVDGSLRAVADDTLIVPGDWVLMRGRLNKFSLFSTVEMV